MTDTAHQSSSSPHLEIAVDHELCFGTGACARQAPDVFAVTGEAETGKAEVRSDVEWSKVDPATVRSAVQACPWGAIELGD
ncbi:ferredoxin [Nocardia harenae]|uniref:ferredoxin n=1 Tax=Nocardia harenae TaxID=358707 RepID=UPI000833FF59|nr:ferredoxin [Nocardia harenae]